MSNHLIGQHVRIGENSTYDTLLSYARRIEVNSSSDIPIFGWAASSSLPGADNFDQQREAKPENTDIVPFEMTAKCIYLTCNNSMPPVCDDNYMDLASVYYSFDYHLIPGLGLYANLYTYQAPTSPTNSILMDYTGVKIGFSGSFILDPVWISISYREGLGDVVTTHYPEEVTGDITSFTKQEDISIIPLSFLIIAVDNSTYTLETTISVKPQYGLPWEGFPIPPN